MTEQTFTVEQGSGTKLITVEGFLELLIAWADDNLKTIARFWAMPGEGWEDSLRTALSSYVEDRHPWADLGAPQTRNVYKTKKPKPKQADFVLNGTVADSASDKVIVEVKTQSIGRLKDFTGDFEGDLDKLDEVDEDHLDCARLAIGVFFTSDWTQSKTAKKGTVPAENAKVSTSFTKWLDKYDHVYFSETYKPIRRAAGTQTGTQLEKAGAIYRQKKSGTGVKPPAGAVELEAWDVHELGIVYKLLPSRRSVLEALERARQEEQERAMQVDEDVEEVAGDGAGDVAGDVVEETTEETTGKTSTSTKRKHSGSSGGSSSRKKQK
ncbi:hypothetical protein [Nonomuraea sp. NPDC050783]|uniref:hypothetical protein n=1 Tax=Nonomuraea sp. NPDC050783 TaxID=3154634 RepID=UPI003465709B